MVEDLTRAIAKISAILERLEEETETKPIVDNLLLAMAEAGLVLANGETYQARLWLDKFNFGTSTGVKTTVAEVDRVVEAEELTLRVKQLRYLLQYCEHIVTRWS